MPKVQTVSQKANGGGSSAKINYATGSGSRPNGGKFTIPSSAPSSKQMIRPKNKIGE